MQLNALIRQTRLLPSEYRLKRDRDLAYLMELKEENLLFPYYTEAGLNGRLNYRPEPWLHGGWDSPLSQIRGTFTGHWLSRQTLPGDRRYPPESKGGLYRG